MTVTSFSGLWIAPDCTAAQIELAHRLAEQFQLTVLQAHPKQGLFLTYDHNGLGLIDANAPKLGAVRSDFLNPELHYRLKTSGAKSEALVKAVGNKGQPWKVLDATPGLGRDSAVLATFGCQVTMIERSPVVAALLQDGLLQLRSSQPSLAEKMHLLWADSVSIMQQMASDLDNANRPDAIYLDPMFPHRKKAALVKKEMQLFQQLLGHDPDADALLAPALHLATRRVIVKRPNSAPPLADKAPAMAIKSKKHRFDVYVIHQTGD